MSSDTTGDTSSNSDEGLSVAASPGEALRGRQRKARAGCQRRVPTSVRDAARRLIRDPRPRDPLESDIPARIRPLPAAVPRWSRPRLPARREPCDRAAFARILRGPDLNGPGWRSHQRGRPDFARSFQQVRRFRGDRFAVIFQYIAGMLLSPLLARRPPVPRG